MWNSCSEHFCGTFADKGATSSLRGIMPLCQHFRMTKLYLVHSLLWVYTFFLSVLSSFFCPVTVLKEFEFLTVSS